MTDEHDKQEPSAQHELPLPGVIAIALYLFLIAGVVVLGVVGGHYPKLYVFFLPCFLPAVAGCLGRSAGHGLWLWPRCFRLPCMTCGPSRCSISYP